MNKGNSYTFYFPLYTFHFILSTLYFPLSEFCLIGVGEFLESLGFVGITGIVG